MSEGPFTCRSCLQATWHDDDLCDECRGSSETMTQDKAEMADLIARLEALAEPDRECDLELWWWCKAIHSGQPMDSDYRRQNLKMDDAPRYTASLDAALTLVPDGWFLRSMGEHTSLVRCAADKHDHINWFAELQWRDGGGRLIHHNAHTLPIVLCCTALRARAQEEGK